MLQTRLIFVPNANKRVPKAMKREKILLTSIIGVVSCYAEVLQRAWIIGRGNGCQTQDGKCEREKMSSLHSRYAGLLEELEISANVG